MSASPSVGTAAAACRRDGRCGHRRRRHDGHPRSHRFACPYHVWRLHAAPAHRRLSRKLSAWRHDHGDLALPKCTCPAGRAIRRASRRSPWRHTPALPSYRPGRHDRSSPARSFSNRASPATISRKLLAEGRLAGQSRLRRRQNALRLCAAGRRRASAARLITTVPHRRLVDPGLRRNHRRPSADDAPACFVPHQWRSDRHAGRRLRAGHSRERHRAAGLHRRQPAHHAAVRDAGANSLAPSIA